jgi:hypothetical protein
MQLSLSFGRRVSSPTLDPGAEKLHTVLLAAGRTGFYAHRLKGVLAMAPGEALAGLPPITVKMFAENREQFTNAAARSAAGSIDRVHMVPEGWRSRLGFPAEAIAGPTGELTRLAGDGAAGQPAATRGARRLIVYTRLGDRLLSSTARDRLWRAFELPAFEQLRGLDCELLASECEAHEGLHLESEAAVFEILEGELVVTSLVDLRYPVLRLRTGLAGSIEHRPCACGGTGARFLVAAEAAPLRKPPSVEFEVQQRERRLTTAL